MPMNQDIKAQWVAALRSGEYKQGKQRLHHAEGDTFCCLGVLCEVAVKAGVDVAVDMQAHGKSYNRNEFTLNEKVQAWAELDACNPLTHEGDADYENIELAHLNDRGYTFEQLATVIERDL